ncbi:Phosphate starvation-inducible protein PsiF [Georgfuchsia toluolica]|uniref:Phosphate starvation-inducible protein PsiF n=1 Tax=Georgfuchsia toluolica TaxID=424218 RepID=A0A916J5I4_9PROT|nr:PsiF family protein [Georgfuchsia toluolica]CAG4884388.1 Phosphate starvation-inducible protein PsiF [Georgfuchsia toluolica]
MSKLIGTLAAAAFVFGLQGQALAATTQQNKMKTCNAEAKEKALKGDERKAFMKDCLSAKKEGAAAKTEEPAAKAEDAKITQQDKMKSCNAEAKTKALKGDERKAFMKECLSADKK